MNTVGLEYGNWLGGMPWNYVATIRKHYPMTEFNTYPMMKRLIRHKAIDRLFFALEPDRQDKMTHAHLMLITSAYYDRERLARELGINKKAVSFLDEVKDEESMAIYCAKHITRPFSFYDLLF